MKACGSSKPYRVDAFAASRRAASEGLVRGPRPRASRAYVYGGNPRLGQAQAGTSPSGATARSRSGRGRAGDRRGETSDAREAVEDQREHQPASGAASGPTGRSADGEVGSGLGCTRRAVAAAAQPAHGVASPKQREAAGSQAVSQRRPGRFSAAGQARAGGSLGPGAPGREGTAGCAGRAAMRQLCREQRAHAAAEVAAPKASRRPGASTALHRTASSGEPAALASLRLESLRGPPCVWCLLSTPPPTSPRPHCLCLCPSCPRPRPARRPPDAARSAADSASALLATLTLPTSPCLHPRRRLTSHRAPRTSLPSLPAAVASLCAARLVLPAARCHCARRCCAVSVALPGSPALRPPSLFQPAAQSAAHSLLPPLSSPRCPRPRPDCSAPATASRPLCGAAIGPRPSCAPHAAPSHRIASQPTPSRRRRRRPPPPPRLRPPRRPSWRPWNMARAMSSTLTAAPTTSTCARRRCPSRS